MKLSAPKQIVWIISLVLGILGVLSLYVAIPVITPHAFWVMVVAWVILILATAMKGL